MSTFFSDNKWIELIDILMVSADTHVCISRFQHSDCLIAVLSQESPMVSKKISKDSWDLKRARRYPYPYPRKQNPSESEVAKVP
jgi:hypothetical protein